MQELAENILFAVLVVALFVLMGLLFRKIEVSAFSRYKLLGPFALLIPGVLKPGGPLIILLLAIGSIATTLLGNHMFGGL